MKLTVNGVSVPVDGSIRVEVQTDSGGEEMPPVTINVSGGGIDVYRSRLTTNGPIHLHPFRHHEDDAGRMAEKGCPHGD